MSAILEFRNTGKSFSQIGERNVILNDVNLSVNKGEIVALIGPSGSGKTTLLQLGGMLDDCSDGDILIDNTSTKNLLDVQKTDLRERYIGFVYQFHYLMMEFDIRYNVAIPLMIRGVDRKNSLSKAEEILKIVGLGDKLEYFPSQLSGGQQQRVSIARAMVKSPALILADEPTGNLDSENAGIVFDIFIKNARNSQSACLFVTHNMDLAKVADRIYKIENKNLVKI